jgi:hypothetical protein
MPMPIHRPQGQITTLPFFRKPNVMSGLFKKTAPNSSTIFKK